MSYQRWGCPNLINNDLKSNWYGFEHVNGRFSLSHCDSSRLIEFTYEELENLLDNDAWVALYDDVILTNADLEEGRFILKEALDNNKQERK